ncbi:MAG TPA: hypothetical protein VFM48_04715 [Aquabacterium sp.]|nr:hypothetical protein [Aquabacterium sp.]
MVSLLGDYFRPGNQDGKIIDGFTFYNEADMLELRLRYLYPYVDEFVIVEADRKFSGEPKPLLLADLMASPRFAWAADKVTIRSLRIDTSGLDLSTRPETFDPKADFWKIEAQQRNAIRPDSMGPNDILLMGDLDEIPAVDFLKAIRSSAWLRFKMNLLPVACDQLFFYYNYKSLRSEIWQGTIAMGARAAAVHSNQEWRDRRKKLSRWRHGGWHFSYFMSAEQIADKIRSFSHQELNTDYMRDTDRIRSAIQQRKDLFERSDAMVEYDPAGYPEELKGLLIKHFPC